MYKLTEPGNHEAIYDSKNNPLPEGKVYFNTHQMLWRDDVLLGRVYLDSSVAKLMLVNNSSLTIPREKFQELFMRDAPIVELVFNANEVEKVELVLNQKEIDSTSDNYCSAILNDYGASKLYGYLHFWFKK